MVTAIHCDVSEPFQIKAVCHFQDIYRKLVRGAADRNIANLLGLLSSVELFGLL
jgi:hypothetical protein